MVVFGLFFTKENCGKEKKTFEICYISCSPLEIFSEEIKVVRSLSLSKLTENTALIVVSITKFGSETVFSMWG